MHGEGSVLVVDDDAELRKLTVCLLTEAGLPCVEADNGQDAIEIVTQAPEAIDLIVLDVYMPGGMDGTEVLRLLQRRADTRHIPVIMVTATATDDMDIVNGVEWGASDYLPKPCSPLVLLAKVRAMRERAVADRKLRQELAQAANTAMTDPLTGLFNRRHFEVRLSEAAAHARRVEQPFSVVMLDIDHFKRINDGHGHPEGDQVLVEFAVALRAVLRADDVAFRYGGEEFVMLLQSCDARRAEEVVHRLRTRLHATPHVFPDQRTQVITFSAGIAEARAIEGYASAELVGRADIALYAAKANGRDQAQSWLPPPPEVRLSRRCS